MEGRRREGTRLPFLYQKQAAALPAMGPTLGLLSAGTGDMVCAAPRPHPCGQNEKPLQVCLCLSLCSCGSFAALMLELFLVLLHNKQRWPKSPFPAELISKLLVYLHI